MGSFVEQTPNAGSYHGELLGLMAIHLILRSMNEVFKDLRGSVHIYSDCLGALNKVENLPPYRIPTKCSHSNILKNIMVNCSDLTFLQILSHMKAQQDDLLESYQMGTYVRTHYHKLPLDRVSLQARTAY